MRIQDEIHEIKQTLISLAKVDLTFGDVLETIIARIDVLESAVFEQKDGMDVERTGETAPSQGSLPDIEEAENDMTKHKCPFDGHGCLMENCVKYSSTGKVNFPCPRYDGGKKI